MIGRKSKKPSPIISHHKEYYAKTRRMAIDILGGKCINCGFSDIRALQIDHIAGDGHIKRKSSKVSSRTVCYEIIQGNVTDYQLLCANCNWIKKSENNEQPYKKSIQELENITL